VTLYEAEERCGGHTLTDEACGVPVDLGFQVRRMLRAACCVLSHYPLDAISVTS
jgi:predicted NAD/FAD-binding protein